MSEELRAEELSLEAPPSHRSLEDTARTRRGCFFGSGQSSVPDLASGENSAGMKQIRSRGPVDRSIHAPPPSMEVLATLTIASTSCCVIFPRIAVNFATFFLSSASDKKCPLCEHCITIRLQFPGGHSPDHLRAGRANPTTTFDASASFCIAHNRERTSTTYLWLQSLHFLSRPAQCSTAS
jgi:hypothetical protein